MAHKTVFLIRHGLTKGNEEKRYTGNRTDEELSMKGIDGVIAVAGKYRDAVRSCDEQGNIKVFCGPLRRTGQTAEILFKELPVTVIGELTETDFGYFEGKNHAELNGDPKYQSWIDSCGKEEIPGAENKEDFIKRSINGFMKALGDLQTDECIAIICHGGNIMSVLSHLTGKDYYDFMLPNLGCYKLELETDDNGISAITYDRIDPWSAA